MRPCDLSRKVNNRIKKGCGSSIKNGNKKKTPNDRYEFDIFANRGYCGEGFYCANYNYMDGKETLSYGKDVHWAYGGALVQNEFPLSNRKGDTPTKCGICVVECTYFKLKDEYKNFDITLFNSHKITINHHTYFYFTTLDYEIFNDLYVSDARTIKVVYYQDIGPLPNELIEFAKENYKLKKQAPESEKPLYEMCFYGLLAKDLRKNLNKRIKEGAPNYKLNKLKLELGRGEALTGLSGYRVGDIKPDGTKETRDSQEIRSPTCIIAAFQTAYLRYREWQLFKQYKDKIIYMNTDSIYTTEPIDTGEDLGLGYYANAYEKKLFLGIRRNAYILLNEDGSFYKSTVGGVMDNYFSPQQINLLKNGIKIQARTMRKNEYDEKVETTCWLTPKYIKEEI